MSSTTTPNMSLTIPAVSNQPGPQYAVDINASLTLIDSHNHAAGQGVQITPDGLNISSDLDFGGNNATGLRSVRLAAQGSPLVLASDLDCLYVVAVDLYYNDGNGNNVRITQGGGVAGSPGSITNLNPPASASYNSGSSTFIWQSGVNIPANMDFASAIFRNLSAGSNGITVQAPAGLASNFSLTLPLLPASQKFMTLDAAGVMSAPWAVDGSTIVVASNIVKVPAQGITATEIQDHSIGLLQLDNTVLQWNTTDYVVVTPGFNVRVATTVNGVMSTAFDNGSVVDGVTLATNDLILIKNQTVQSDNGVYVVAASGTPARSTSYDTVGELNYAGVHVTAGTVNASTDWFQNNILTLITDNQSWTQSQTYLLTVPANVNAIFFDMVGGGGGGGSGSVNSGGSSTMGAGGGAGSQPIAFSLKVTPGDQLYLTVGNKGKGGAKATTTTGITGNSGGDTWLRGVAAGRTVYYYIPGASGGEGGKGNVTGTVALGGTTYANNNTLNGLTAVSPGGNGSTSGIVDALPGGASVLNFAAAPGGVHYAASPSVNRPAPGGGGGSGMGVGGSGGDGTNALANTFNNGGNAPALNYGAGGGGSSGTFSTAPSAGPVGGDGAGGLIRAKWLGAP